MKRASIAAAFGVALLATGCDRVAPDGAAVPAPAGGAHAVVTAEKGPVKVTLSLAPNPPALSDEPLLTLTVEVASGAGAELPPFGSDPSNSGAFRVLELREPPPELDPATGKKTLTRTCRLEPLESGDHVIAPVTIAFRQDDAAHEVTTEPLAVTVTAPLAGSEATLDGLRPPLAPGAIAVPRDVPWLALSLCAAGLLLGIVLFVTLLRRRRARPAPPPTPLELALREFRALIADDPLARGELTTFYVELTAIVRRHVERTTGVHAPEQTTEEFLRTCHARGVFDPDTRGRLIAFLAAADLVKFAAGRPAQDDVADSFRRAQQFVGLPGDLALPSLAPRASRLAEAAR